MKKTAIYVATVVASLFSTAYAQNVSGYFDNALQTAENIGQDAQTGEAAVDKLVKELTLLGNPDILYFQNSLLFVMNNMQNNADDIDYFMGEAQQASPVAFSVVPVTVLTAQLVVQNDDVVTLTQAIVDAVGNGNTPQALSFLQELQESLAAQTATGNELIAAIDSIRTETALFEVVIVLIDAQGNPVSYNDLFGYYAHNNTTGEYHYPEYNLEDRFFLPAGNYTFDSFDGYWSGTSSTTVTLSHSLVNENGVIIVELVYWSE